VGRIAIHVLPGARATAVAGPFGDAIKVRVAAPAERGAANATLIRFLADVLGVATARVAITRGAGARRKQVEVADLDDHAIRARLLARGTAAAPPRPRSPR